MSSLRPLGSCQSSVPRIGTDEQPGGPASLQPSQQMRSCAPMANAACRVSVRGDRCRRTAMVRGAPTRQPGTRSRLATGRRCAPLLRPLQDAGSIHESLHCVPVCTFHLVVRSWSLLVRATTKCHRASTSRRHGSRQAVSTVRRMGDG